MFTHTNENREFWIKEVSLDADLIEDIRNSDILFLPVREYRNINNIFYTTAGDFFKYIKKQNDFCINQKPLCLQTEPLEYQRLFYYIKYIFFEIFKRHLFY